MAESHNHLRLKGEILRLCDALGYTAISEAGVGRARADVLARKGTTAIAFEIQWSPESLGKTKARQQRYLTQGVQGCWLFREPTKQARTREASGLPIFHVGEQEGAYQVALLDRRRHAPLADFIAAFLQGGIKFCEAARTMKKQRAELVFYPMDCWKCRATNHAFALEPYLSSCNFKLLEMGSLWTGERPEFSPEILGALQRTLTADSRIRLGPIKARHSKTVEKSYRSFGCIECDSIFGDWFINVAGLEARQTEGNIRLPVDITLENALELAVPHWCYPVAGNFCDGTALPVLTNSS